jgi:predicted Zn finger-like uncharacterized protein
MKVVCESCQAKYQVPDERVAGKKLKIRCKRCGATVLIRGDLVADAYERPAAPLVSEAPAPLESVAPAASDYESYEWHVSLDGDTRGPFDTEGVRNWLNTTPSGWDAHVWREGFPDWIEARACAELDPPPAAPAVTSLQEDELPTQTFQAQSRDGAAFMADLAAPRGSMRSTQIGHPSALRSRTPNGIETSPAPRVTTPEPYDVERQEDSVLFSQPNLQTMTSPSSYVPGPNPGFANGEGSGLIDIRALASLARQGTTQIAPSAPGANNAKVTGSVPASGADPSLSFGLDDDARIALAGQQGGFARIDSLAPVSNAPQTSNVALPLAILGGCALVAAAVFAAILFTRPPRSAEVMAVTQPNAQTKDAIGATAQPPAEDQGPPEPSNADLNAQEREAAKAMPAEPGSQAEPANPSEDELAAAKKHQGAHAPHQVVEEKKGPTPEEKAKPKHDGHDSKEEKPDSQASSTETMLADRAKPVKQPTPAPEAKPAAPAPETSTNAASDIDSLIADKPAKPAAPKGPRSIDDLMNGADKNVAAAAKPAAPTAAATPAAATSSASDLPSDLPESPSRDETLAAMRGVEAAVRACNTGPEATTGTAEVALTVAGSTGRVTTANVTGITGNVGSCIARAVRNARFPRFSKPTFSIKYPYRF